MPKPMRMEEKIKYFMQVTDAPWSVAVRKLQKHGGNLSKALEDLHNHIHITIHMPGGGCLRCIFVKSDNLQDVYGYLWQLGLGEYASESYRLETQFPGRCYSIEDGWLTLDELGLGNGGDLYLEKKK
ncbi:hypothetical protein GLYMA_03G011800v4 [Glycine max]|nr:uncharacterized protein LOC102663854 [Glycine max]XP_028223735.1 uncharacterized protein LOC114405358 [Glycine soja]KAG4393068.1 hypothetical protein GLYMA_03G011800v4 [Glycine max]KAH1068139.1 hypothetical protein GYH30_005910 [Glycine max]